MNFDPMTGKPIEENEDMNFDPMTGKPIERNEDMNFDPMTGKPIQNKGRGKIRLSDLPGAVKAAAAIALVVAIALIIASSGLFRSKTGKVMLAAANTVRDTPHFVKALKPLSMLNGNNYTITFVQEGVSSVAVSGEIRNGGSEKQVALTLGQTKTLELLAGVDQKSAKLYVPELSKHVFVYHYKDKNTGYLMKELDDDDIGQINAVLESVAKKSGTKDICSDLFRIFKDELKSIKFENIDKKEYTVNDKDVNCKGYSAVIKGSNMVRVANKIEKLMEENYADIQEMDGFSEAFDDLRDELEDIDEIKLKFYIYKNRLAAIICEDSYGDEAAELCFEGGDYRMQNMVLKIGSDKLRITGSDDKTSETFVLDLRENGKSKTQIGSLEYDYKNGSFWIDLPGIETEGELKGSKSELKLKISNISVENYRISPRCEIVLKKGAKMEKYDGKEFDLGNADKAACRELLEDIQDKIYDGGFEYITRHFGLSWLLDD